MILVREQQALEGHQPFRRPLHTNLRLPMNVV
jgi:hypothetical protein